MNDRSTQADRDKSAEQGHYYAASSTGHCPPPVCTCTRVRQHLEHNPKAARHKSAANNKSYGIVSFERVSQAHAVTGTNNKAFGL